MSKLKQLPLDAFHRRHGARMEAFAGWSMPLQYTGIISEHRVVREAVGLFDVSHMGEAVISGPQAEAFLDNLLPNRILGMPVGKGVYTPMCHPSGGTIDDLIVYRLTQNEFLACINAANIAKDIAWMQQQAARFDCEVRDVSSSYVQLALQGPKAPELLAAMAGEGENLLPKRFHFIQTELQNIPSIICTTGYTGEAGCEIYTHPDNAEALAEALLQCGEAHGLQLCGLGARDSLRLEAGYALYGHELSDTISPLEAGLSWTVKLDKGEFIGREALQAQQAEGLKRQIVFFVLSGPQIARAGASVFCKDEKIGEVVSGTHSPSLGKPIGSALVQADAAQSPKLEVDIRGKRLLLEIKKPPLHL